MDSSLPNGSADHNPNFGEPGARPPAGADEPAAAPRPLLPKHRAEPEASGLTAETIAANGVYSECDPKAVAALLNWGTGRAKALGAVLVYPHFDRHGAPLEHATVKPDNPRPRADKPGKVKYENPRQRPNRLYVPAGARAALADPAAPLFITEGVQEIAGRVPARVPVRVPARRVVLGRAPREGERQEGRQARPQR